MKGPIPTDLKLNNFIFNSKNDLEAFYTSLLNYTLEIFKLCEYNIKDIKLLLTQKNIKEDLTQLGNTLSELSEKDEFKQIILQYIKICIEESINIAPIFLDDNNAQDKITNDLRSIYNINNSTNKYPLSDCDVIVMNDTNYDNQTDIDNILNKLDELSSIVIYDDKNLDNNSFYLFSIINHLI